MCTANKEDIFNYELFNHTETKQLKDFICNDFYVLIAVNVIVELYIRKIKEYKTI